MSERIDCWGRAVTVTVEGGVATYAAAGMVITVPAATPLDQAMRIVEAMAPPDAGQSEEG